MEQISLMSEQFRQATMKLLEDPDCPLFPDLTVFLYQVFGGLWSILDWMGAPVKFLLSSLVARLSFRAWKVAWARATKEQRMGSMMLGAIVGPVGLMMANPKKFRELLKKAEAA